MSSNPQNSRKTAWPEKNCLIGAAMRVWNRRITELPSQSSLSAELQANERPCLKGRGWHLSTAAYAASDLATHAHMQPKHNLKRTIKVIMFQNILMILKKFTQLKIAITELGSYHTSLLPASQETKTEGSFSPRNSRPAWTEAEILSLK